ncbi:MAG: hypothetical protein EBU90_01515 [Proteobacteria bacterium]|nr:hypothetical protein [Pseudomonadota bacterium]
MSSATSNYYKTDSIEEVPKIIRDETHTYKDGSELEYTSVTSLIGKFKNKFDTEKVSKEYSEKHKIPQDEVKKRWMQMCLDACEKGSLLHDLMEKGIEDIDAYVKAEMNNYLSPSLARDVLSSKDISQFQDEKKYLIVKEPIIAFPIPKIMKGLAGGIDFIAEEIGTNVVHLRDWKTNKALNRSGYRNQMMKYPLSHLPDCNYQHYVLQLSLYAYILEVFYKKKIGSLGIHHFNYLANTVQYYEVPYLKSDVSDMLSVFFHNNIMKKVC